MRDFRSDVVAAMGQSAIVVNQKGLSVAFWPKILAESLSVSAERTFPVSAYLPKAVSKGNSIFLFRPNTNIRLAENPNIRPNT